MTAEEREYSGSLVLATGLTSCLDTLSIVQLTYLSEHSRLLVWVTVASFSGQTTDCLIQEDRVLCCVKPDSTALKPFQDDAKNAKKELPLDKSRSELVQTIAERYQADISLFFFLKDVKSEMKQRCKRNACFTAARLWRRKLEKSYLGQKKPVPTDLCSKFQQGLFQYLFALPDLDFFDGVAVWCDFQHCCGLGNDYLSKEEWREVVYNMPQSSMKIYLDKILFNGKPLKITGFKTARETLVGS